MIERIIRRFLWKPCRDWSCRSANPYHEEHTTRLGTWLLGEGRRLSI